MRKSILPILLIASASTGTVWSADAPAPWIRIAPALLAGDLPPVPSSGGGGLPIGSLQPIEQAADPRRAFVHSGLIQTVIFQTSSSATRSLDYPGDQVVRVLSGSITFTDEPSGRRQEFRRGDHFIVPRHWRGTWVMKKVGRQPARILVRVDAARWLNSQSQAFDAGASSSPSPGMQRVDLRAARARISPMSFESPLSKQQTTSSTSGHVIYAGELSLLLLKSRDAAAYRRETDRCESTVQILAGRLTLETDGKSETFAADEVVVLTPSFHGTVRVSSGFSALSVVAARAAQSNPVETGTPSVQVCPAM